MKNCVKICDKKMDWSKWFIKWIIFCQQQYKNLKAPMLRSDLCDYSDAYIVVKGIITVEDTVDVSKK